MPQCFWINREYHMATVQTSWMKHSPFLRAAWAVRCCLCVYVCVCLYIYVCVYAVVLLCVLMYILFFYHSLVSNGLELTCGRGWAGIFRMNVNQSEFMQNHYITFSLRQNVCFMKYEQHTASLNCNMHLLKVCRQQFIKFNLIFIKLFCGSFVIESTRIRQRQKQSNWKESE